MDIDSAALADSSQHFTCGSVQLASHDLRSRFQNHYLFFCFFHLPGCLKAKNSSSDHYHIVYSVQYGFQLFNIGHTADSDHLRLICSRNRRNKALRSKSINKFCIFQLRSVGKLHFLLFCIYCGHFFIQKQVYIVFLIPFFRLYLDLFGVQLRYHGFCQHRTVISNIRLVGDHDNRACQVSFSDRLRRA